MFNYYENTTLKSMKFWHRCLAMKQSILESKLVNFNRKSLYTRVLFPYLLLKSKQEIRKSTFTQANVLNIIKSFVAISDDSIYCSYNHLEGN